jgi:antitoxin component YwqK of YwqJK toxin-antitoxin module
MGIFDFFKKNKNITNQNGLNEIYYNNGKGNIKEKWYSKNGFREGLTISYYESGEVSYKREYGGVYTNYRGTCYNQFNGKNISFYKNGQIRNEGDYLNNVGIGIHNTYYKNGQLFNRELKKNSDNEPKKVTKYYPDGKIVPKKLYSSFTFKNFEDEFRIFINGKLEGDYYINNIDKVKEGLSPLGKRVIEGLDNQTVTKLSEIIDSNSKFQETHINKTEKINKVKNSVNTFVSFKERSSLKYNQLKIYHHLKKDFKKEIVVDISNRKDVVFTSDSYDECKDWINEDLVIIENKKLNGKHKYMFENGVEHYDGEWKNGKKNGYGVLKDTKYGDSHEGQWIDGKQNGIGTYRDSSGKIITGDWKDGKIDLKDITYSKENGKVLIDKN